MKKATGLMSLLVLGGIGASLSAQAQTAGGNVTVVDNTSNPAINEGTFHVTATKDNVVANQWDIRVDWVADINLHPAFVDDIQIRFLNASNQTQTIASGSGGTYNSSAMLGTPYDFSLSLSNKQANFDNPDAPHSGAVSASSVQQGVSFVGKVLLANNSSVSKVYFNLFNGGSGQGTFSVQATPEAASLAMLLPGLLPIGVAVRRRRSNRA